MADFTDNDMSCSPTPDPTPAPAPAAAAPTRWTHPCAQFPGFSQEFVNWFCEAMYWETGSRPNLADLAFVHGDISTPHGRLVCGYVNNPNDHGGETKYGVAQKANPQIVVRTLDFAGAMAIAWRNYWTPAHGEQIPYPLSAFICEMAWGSGLSRGVSMVQGALGIRQDGVLGPQTLAACDAVQPGQEAALLESCKQARIAFYRAIVAHDPSQGVFLNGWLRRANQWAVPPIQ